MVVLSGRRNGRTDNRCLMESKATSADCAVCAEEISVRSLEQFTSMMALCDGMVLISAIVFILLRNDFNGNNAPLHQHVVVAI